jgi:hypothetical protein
MRGKYLLIPGEEKILFFSEGKERTLCGFQTDIWTPTVASKSSNRFAHIQIFLLNCIHFTLVNFHVPVTLSLVSFLVIFFYL